MAYKIVMVDDILPITDVERKVLGQLDMTLEQHNCLTPNDAERLERLERVAGDADAVMTVGAKLDREAFARLKNCKVIGRYGGGIDNIDLEAATENGVVVTYVPVYCQEEVAALAVTLMLACERRLIQADKVVKSGDWKGSIKACAGARSHRGKTLGIVGFGAIGRTLVPLVRPFGIEVIAYDPYINLEHCKELGVRAVELQEIIETSDYISLHVPLTPQTRHMFGDKQFDQMKNDAILINTGRGAVVDQKALYTALKEGKIAAAGIDVLEAEPPNPEDPIFTLENVITSGHIAAATNESIERLRTLVSQGVVDVLSGKWPGVIANPKIKEKLTLQ
ncbi:MAG: C-terminal binding protein [Defluviitaleaceae bacterium]|nr:C-terminal binding protein [Defluviitaleaceae bacterium]